MTFVPVLNAVEAELIYRYDGQKCENTLWFQYDHSPDATELTDLASALKTWWVGAFGTNLVPSLVMNMIKITDQSIATGLGIEYTTGLPVAGTASGDGMPGGTAACISFNTGLRGRSARGRNYVMGMPKSVTTLSTLDSGWMAAITGAYNALPAALPTPGPQWVVASRFSGVDPLTGDPIPRVTGITNVILSAAFADNSVDSQRRRLIGRGE